MNHSPKQHRRIRAVYPSGENKRGYRVVFIMHDQAVCDSALANKVAW
jgi:hypothetical protein